MCPCKIPKNESFWKCLENGLLMKSSGLVGRGCKQACNFIRTSLKLRRSDILLVKSNFCEMMLMEICWFGKLMTLNWIALVRE